MRKAFYLVLALNIYCTVVNIYYAVKTVRLKKILAELETGQIENEKLSEGLDNLSKRLNAL